MVEVYQYPGQNPIAGRKEIDNDFSMPPAMRLALSAAQNGTDYTRRIIDLETRIAALEAALDKLKGEK